MKIVFVTSVYAPNGLGGAERTVQTLAEMLVRLGHQATVISLAPDGLASKGDVNGVRTHYVPLANVHWPFGGQRRNVFRRAAWQLFDSYNPVMGARVGRILEEERPDVLQTSNLLGFSVAVWRAAKKLRIPVVQMLHDYYLGCTNSSMFRNGANCESQCRRCTFYAQPRKWLSPLPVAVISLSQRMLSLIERAGMFKDTPHKIVIHGANKVMPGAPLRLRSLRHRCFTVGYLGRMEVTKGVESLLDAVMQLPRGRVRVVLAGTGAPAYLASLRERVDSPDIEFIGYVNPSELFARVDLLVVPSLWEEPLGRVIYEGYAHGVPSLVSRSGGMPEIVDEGRTGFFFEPGNAGSLASVMSRLADGWDGERYQQACLAKSREFAIDTVVTRYLQVWQRAAGIVPTDRRQMAEAP